MPISLSRKLNGVVLIALFAAGILIAFWPYYTASGEMQGFCQGLASGTPIVSIKSAATAHGYEVVTFASGRTFVDDPRSFGRLRCGLTLNANGQLSAKAFDGD